MTSGRRTTEAGVHPYSGEMSHTIEVPPSLREGGVELRPVSAADVPAFVDAFKDPAIAQGAYHNRLEGSEEAMSAYLGRNRERMESGEGVLLGIWETGAAAISGQTMLFNFDWEERTAELGFWMAPAARRRGLTGTSLRLTLKLAFDHLGIERVCGLTGTDNVGAQRAMEGAGMSREGVLRGLEKLPDGRLDQVCFAILADDPRP
jgi:ribosomal-protein-alanine N-acetyltransferase